MFTDLLMQTQRKKGSRKKVSIIDPAKYREFFVRLPDEPMDPEIKAILCVAVSGGLRISEALALRRCDFDFDNGFVKVKVLKKDKYYTSRGKTEKIVLKASESAALPEILEQARKDDKASKVIVHRNGSSEITLTSAGKKKKAHVVYRDAYLEPEAIRIVKEFVEKSGTKNFERVFGVRRNTVHNHIKKHFGDLASAHTIARHTFMTYLIQEKGQSNDDVQAIMEVSRSAVDFYSHMNVKKRLKEIKDGQH